MAEKNKEGNEAVEYKGKKYVKGFGMMPFKPVKSKRSTSDGFMAKRKESVIERSNRQVAERNAGKTKKEISEAAFKSGRTSGRY
jgi:hypothetical protein